MTTTGDCQAAFIVRAGAVEWTGAGTFDPCGRPRTNILTDMTSKLEGVFLNER